MLVAVPRQDRSIQTMTRLVAAAEELLETSDFADLRLDDVAARAGVTVGAFYARFRDKETFLQYLEQLIVERMRDVVADAADKMRIADLRTAIEMAIAFYRRNRGILRALVGRSRSDAALRARLDQANVRQLQAFVPALARKMGRVSKQRLELAILMVTSLMRESILFGGALPSFVTSDRVLARELTRAFLAYVGSEER